MYSIYKHTSPSRKCYIGMTCQKPERRWRNGEGYRECRAFYNAIKKYGWDNIKHEILEENLSFEDACKMEKHYISEYDSLVNGNGYNLETGGYANHSVSDETRAKISTAISRRKRKPLTFEQKKRISDSRKGKKMPPKSAETRKKLSEANKGRVFSEEHCRHLSESKKGMYVGENNPRARKVVCVENNMVFNTINDAGIFINRSPKNIISCCRGRLKSVGGYSWKYFEEVVNT